MMTSSSINQDVNTQGQQHKFQIENKWAEREYLLGYHFLCLNLQRNLSNLWDRGSFLSAPFSLSMTTHCSAAICLATSMKYGLFSSPYKLPSLCCYNRKHANHLSFFPLYVCNQETITGNKINKKQSKSEANYQSLYVPHSRYLLIYAVKGCGSFLCLCILSCLSSYLQFIPRNY